MGTDTKLSGKNQRQRYPLKTGAEGNPNGRPKSHHSITSHLQSFLLKKFRLSDIEELEAILTGKVKKSRILWSQLLAWRLLIDAARGNQSAMTQVLNRTEGIVRQVIDVNSERVSIHIDVGGGSEPTDLQGYGKESAPLPQHIGVEAIETTAKEVKALESVKKS